MARDPELNTHFLNYVATCLRHGVSPKTIREALLAMGDLSDRTVDIFLNRPELRALTRPESDPSELTPHVDTADLPPLDYSASVAPPMELVLETRRLIEATRSEIDLPTPSPMAPRAAAVPETAPSISLDLESPLGAARSYSRPAAAPASVEIESPLRQLAFGRDTILKRVRRRVDAVHRFFSRLHRRTFTFLESVVAYSALALLFGLLALQLVDRLDPLLLTGAQQVSPSGVAGRAVASPPQAPQPIQPIRTILPETR